MKEKPTQVRFVSRKQYRRIRRKRAGAYLTAIGAACFGIACLTLGGIGMSYFQDATAVVVFFGGLGVLGIWCGRLLWQDARKIERVALLTPQNAKDAPDEKILVRSSDCPSAELPKVLLRPLEAGAEANSEELLRASQGQNLEDVKNG